MTSHFTLESNVRISSFAKMSDMVKSPEVYHDLEFMENNKHIADEWRRIADLYPEGSSQPLLPETFSRDQFGQGNHYECFMLSALSTLIRFPDVIRHCFVTTEVQPDGHYTFQFFRDKEWVKVEIDDYIAMDGDEVLYIRSPDESWWPLLLEKAYAKFYTAYDHLEGCTLQEAYHDLTGNPVLTIPMQPKLAKSAGVEVAKGSYWLSLAQRIQSGHFAASVLTRDLDVESIGLQREQQYGVLDIFSMTGTSHVEDIVIQLHNPFEDEEYTYTGPLNSRDTAWTDKLRAKYHVNEDERSIFIPLATFLKIMNSFQLCYISPIDPNSITYFHDEWKGLTAGGNPTMVTWRNNPLYLVRNVADTMATVVVSIKNEDQRQSTPTDERSAYVQCGVLLVQYAYPDPIPTYWVTGNNHKSIFRSLFLNSREVSNTITIPPRSTCYLVPSCLQRGVEDTFTMAIHKMKDTDYSGLTVQKLSLPDKDFEHPTTASIELRQKEKGRVDFYVDEPTDVHILLHQTKPYVSKSGGDAMTEDYVGMYLYDDTDHKIGGVHAATNYREISVIHRLPRSGRYAVSVTCPRAKDDEVVPLVVSFVGKREAHVRIVDAPDDATIFDDEEDFIDDGGKKEETNPVDASSIILHSDDIVECPDSNTPFEDRRFMSLNRVVTTDPWVHIGDLYPVGKTLPLLPEVLSREQFQRGTSQECACLTAFAVLVEHHPDVIRHCFVSQQPRKDGRYVFRFHRYGRWVSVEIDDRIPQTGGRTVFCESPTEHWWPLLLEKAYAKFYSMYHNLEGCTMDEIFHDFTGRPVVCASSEAQLSAVAFWMNLKTLASEKHSIVLAANSKKEMEEPMGLLTGTSFGILDILPTKGSDSTLEDVLIAMYNPFGSACTYSGPMDPSDSRWTDELRAAHKPGSEGVMLIPASIFASLFDGVQQAYIGSTALVDPSLHFNSEWAVGTTGGNPEMLAWRENPLYVVRNTSDKAIDVVAMIGQVDQRHALHRQTQAELNYIQCGLVLAQLSDPHAQQIPTYLVTRNTHELIAQQEPFLRTREASTFFSIPPQSLCYLVPSGAIREKGTFMLSYWLLDRSEEAEKHLSIERLAITVAHNFPAIGQVELANHGRGRVDFVLDAASDVHVLLTQVKAFKGSNGVNSLAEDVVEMSLYNSVGELIYHAPAGGRREVGMVCHVDHAGRYSVLVRCVEGHGQVPCKVEVVATKEANARIADIPDGAHELGEADLSFLDPAPEGVPLADLPLDRDEVFLNRVDVLKRLHPDVNSPEEYECAREPIKERVEELALEEIAKDRPEYLAGRDLEALNPLLDADADYMAAEKARYPLMKEAVAEPTPEHQSALEAAEEDLRRRADNLKEADDRRDFESLLEPEYEGIPLADIDPSRDPIYQELVQQRAALLTDYASNASKITAFEEALHERIRVLAEEMHAQERNFYDREPEGVPLELVPLNTDVEVSTKEDELRALRRGDVSVSQPQVTEIEQQLNRRSHELAANLKQEERKMFLDQEPLGISVTSLPVDEDEEFHAKEVQRLRLRHASLTETEPEIQQLEKEMNERAKVLAQERRDNLWSFLDQEPYGIPIDKLGLEYAQEFMAMESRLRELTDDSAADPAAVAAVQKEMADFVEAVASAQAAQDREFLDPTPEGRQLDTLNITSVPEFLAMDKDRRRIKFAVAEKEDGGDHAEEIEKMCALEKDMNALAHDLARQKNVEERPAFMLPEYKSISRSHLPLDEDPAFADMESQRQVLKWEPDRNSRAISEVEADLNNRANELAMQQLHESRGYLNPSPDGVPLHVLPLDTDETFCEGEQHRHQLLAATPVDEEAVAAQEASLNARAVEMAKAMRAEERPKFLAATYNEIPTEQLPLDSDEAFLQQEADRLVLQKNGEDTAVVESALTQRAQELADAQIEQGRAFLDPLPGGVPIAVVHPERDATFTAQEAERREALRKDPVDPAAVEELEKHMNARVLELSEALRQRAREEVLPAAPGGIPRSALQLDEDATYLEREAAYLQATNGLEPGHPAAEAEATSMQERAVEMAASLRDAERAALHIPLGYTLGDIPFDESADYVAEEAKLCEQRHLNSRDEAPASAVEELEQRLQAITRELAWAKAYGELGILHPEPAGRKLLSLPLSSDAPFEKLVEQLHQVPAERAATIDAMNERALVLAKELNASERPQYLPAEMQGVPMARLPLDGDEAFGALEVERARCLQDPQAEGHAAELAEKEAALRARAEELAMVAVQQQRAFLDAEPEGVALHHIPYEEDPCFQQLERERIHALGNNAEEVAPLEERMNLRLHELATEMKLADRAKLEPTVLGIPREDLYTDMDANEEFHQTEERYREAKTKDPESLPAIEEELNAQARGLAEHRHAEERAHLNQHPEGVPLAALPLNEDEPFLELEHAARMEVPPTSEEEVAQARQPLNQRAAELARESRLAYCDAAPEGIPLELLRLGERDDFVAKEQERRDLLASGALPEQVQEANTGLNSAAHDVARTMLHDRRGYLDPLPEGVPLVELPLNADEPFKTMEVERAITQLRGGEDADARVAALEQQLNERAHAVATKQKEEDLEGLEPRPYSIPLKWLNLHADEPFHAQLPPLREKKQMNVDGCNDAAIDDIHAALNARALELAKERSAVDRAFLDREPEGVPLEQLPLNEDAPFTNMEEERREAHKNNNAEAVAELEDRLQARAKELARNKLVEDRMYLNPSPDGMTLDELSVDDDESFHVMEAERAKLKSNPDENAEAIRELEEKLNERAKELAHKAKQRSRAFLRPTSSDIPVELLPLDGDADFVAMERQLRPLQREDAHCNAPMIEKLQEQMQARADELGEVALKSDRPSYLDAAPAGVPVADIPLDEDASYHGMEVERAIQKLKHPNDEAPESQAELEKQLNQRAHELAAQVRAEERALLDQEPEGIPLEDVPLDDDAKFRNMEEYCRKLRRDPAQNAAAVDETRLKLNDRSHELARGVVAEDLACLPWEVYRKAHKDAIGLHDYDRFREAANRRRRDRKRGADPVEMAAVEEEMNAIAKSIVDEDVDERRAFLDQKPEGMHVQDLPLDTDPIFSALEGDRSARALSREDNERKMNDRAHELAKEAFAERRRTFMDQEPEGVPLVSLPLDVDGPFKESEIACYDLTYQKPSLTEAEQARVEELHAAMNARARELAKSEIMRDQAFLDPEPEGVPLEDLPLSSDATFAELMKERRALKQQGGKGCASAVAKKEAEINARTHELARAFLQEHRHYLNPEPQNVPIADVPLNGDDSFREKERELLAKTRDGATPEELAAMHAGLNERAEELAVQLLRKERAMQDQEPLGVPLEELPLNYDAHLNPMERERRALKKAPQRNMEDVRSVEGKIGQRTHAIAADYLTAERAFMDQQPEGVPLNCLNLSGDADFHGMEKQLRAEKHELPAGDATSPAVQATQARMNARAHVLASELLARERTFLNQAPLGIPLRELPLNEDEQFHHMEAQRRAMCEQRPLPEKELHRLEDTMKERVMELAREKQAADRAFLDQKPLGIPIEEVPLDEDRTFRAMETELRAMRQQPDADVATQEKEMNDRSKELARRLLADDRLYLDPKPLGVPIAELNVDEDEEFHAGELQRREMKKNTSQTPRMKEQLASMEESLNERAQQLAEDYLKKDRAYLDQEPEGVPLEEVGVDEDPEFVAMEEQRRKMRRTDPPATEGEMKAMEDRLNARAHDLARTRKGFQDEDFHAANADVAESWRRIGDLYPEGAYDPLVPSPTLPFDVCSGPKDMGYLAPFIAALARHTPLIARLFPDGAHPQNQPYRITLYDSNSAPVVVEIDDRIPCDATRESPKFSQSPDRLWYPLLLEKAYAKFVGGYEKINHCNAHDTLRDLTGRPVLHISLEDPKHAAAAHLGDFSAPAFWRSLAKDLRRGDVVVCVANATAPSGFHPLCSYALLDVISLDSNATDGNSIVLKLHNSYVDEPSYTGRLHAEQDWTEEMKRACKYDPTEGNVMYVPLPTFLDNFACMQRCHINCGDRVSAPGEWNEFTAGGTPKFTTFRSNPIYLVENKSACPAPIMAELCHSGPLYVDEHGCERYPYTGIALLQTLDPKLPATPLLTNSTHQFLQKGMMLDSREVCSVMEIPASSTCYIVPYTKDRGTYGKFKLSVYPDVARVQLTPLRYAGLSLSPLTTEVVLPPMDEFGEGTRLDFLVSAATDVHILLRQASFVEGERRGDVLSEMSVAMSAFNEYGIKVGTTGEPSASREQALVFKAPQSGLYSLVASCAGSSTEPCKASVSVFVPVGVSVDFVPIQPDARQLFLQAQQPRFPTLPRTMTMTSSSRANSRERPLSGERRSSAAMRRADSASGRVQRSTSARQRRGSVGERSPALNRTSSRTRR